MIWLDISELVAGLIIKGDINPQVVRPSTLHPPFDKLAAGFREGKDLSDMAGEIGFRAIADARMAASSMDDELPLDWIRMLEKSAAGAEAAQTLKYAAKKLEKGEPIDQAEISRVLRQTSEGYTDLLALSEVDPQTIIWTPTHYDPIDRFVGGIPIAGLTTIGGPPGTGKTGLAIKIMAKTAKAGKSSFLFSQEMTRAQISLRQIEIEKLTKKERGRIFVSESPMDIDQIYARASARAEEEKAAIIIIDYADMVMRGESGTSPMEHVYKTSKNLAKVTGVPVILLAQLNEKYTGGIPKVNHLRWSRMAEAVSDLILLIYNPNQLWADSGKETSLIATEGAGYIIVGKSKFGLNSKEEDVRGLGAIQVGWDGKASWSEKVHGWFDLSGGR